MQLDRMMYVTETLVTRAVTLTTHDSRRLGRAAGKVSSARGPASSKRQKRQQRHFFASAANQSINLSEITQDSSNGLVAHFESENLLTTSATTSTLDYKQRLPTLLYNVGKFSSFSDGGLLRFGLCRPDESTGQDVPSL
jgi:hypothetical protein